MKDKFVKKYMRIAKLIGEDQNPCHSRKIGAVIVDPKSNRILGTGYNGPAPGTPHPTSEEFLREFFWPQLTKDEKVSIACSLPGMTTDRFINLSENIDQELYILDLFINEYKNKPICPRRIVGAGAGQRSELCSCGHAERHAITNAAQCCNDAYMFCWCGVPCIQCTDAIIQSGIKRVYCLKAADYQEKARWLFDKSMCFIIEKPSEWYLTD